MDYTDKTWVLKQLASGEPLFTHMPEVKLGVSGVEIEFGTPPFETDSPKAQLENERDLKGTLFNGGKLVLDHAHLEYCSPEVSNAVQAVAYDRAGDPAALHFAPVLYRSNADWRGNGHRQHENYFTSLPSQRYTQLIPFLLARTILDGTGRFSNEDMFELSSTAARLTHIIRPQSSPRKEKGIIHDKNSPLTTVQGMGRVQIEYSHTKQCQTGIFLTNFITQTALALAEQGDLPHTAYDLTKTLSDAKTISRQTAGWVLQGTPRPISATQLLADIVDNGEKYLKRDDEVTTAGNIIVRDTLKKLDCNPFDCYGRLDWVTKWYALTEFRSHVKGANTVQLMRDNELSYDKITRNPTPGQDGTEGLFEYLQRINHIERIVSDQMIAYAAKHPPLTTRANVRGIYAQKLHAAHKRSVLYAKDWNACTPVDPQALIQNGPNALNRKAALLIGDPRQSYDGHIGSIDGLLQFVE